MKKLLKLFSTKYRKVNLFGDYHAFYDNGGFYPFRGKRLDVKLFGLFWVTYYYYLLK